LKSAKILILCLRFATIKVYNTNFKFKQVIDTIKEGGLDKISKAFFSNLSRRELRVCYPKESAIHKRQKDRRGKRNIKSDKIGATSWKLIVSIIDKEESIDFNYSIRDNRKTRRKR